MKVGKYYTLTPSTKFPFHLVIIRDLPNRGSNSSNSSGGYVNLACP
jgi:hypothetical protein